MGKKIDATTGLAVATAVIGAGLTTGCSNHVPQATRDATESANSATSEGFHKNQKTVQGLVGPGVVSSRLSVPDIQNAIAASPRFIGDNFEANIDAARSEGKLAAEGKGKKLCETGTQVSGPTPKFISDHTVVGENSILDSAQTRDLREKARVGEAAAYRSSFQEGVLTAHEAICAAKEDAKRPIKVPSVTGSGGVPSTGTAPPVRSTSGSAIPPIQVNCKVEDSAVIGAANPPCHVNVVIRGRNGGYSGQGR